jgi:hypothetical protein
MEGEDGGEVSSCIVVSIGAFQDNVKMSVHMV